jgi:hypothetical protein
VNRLPGILAATCAAVLALSGCTAAPEADGRPCVEIPAGWLDRIAEGASGVAMTPVAGAGVEHTGGGYVVAMRFSAPGGDDETGLWALSTLEDTAGNVGAIDGTAKAFTQWPAIIDGVKLGPSTDGVPEAEDCLSAM